MRFLLQKVQSAQVQVAETTVGAIQQGLVVFIGIAKNDTKEMADRMIKKLLNGRFFPSLDGSKHFDVAFSPEHGKLLLVSQFTLYASHKKGRRPSFDEAASPEDAKVLYEYLVSTFKQLYPESIETGIFQEHMVVSLENTGPVTFLIDSDTDL